MLFELPQNGEVTAGVFSIDIGERGTRYRHRVVGALKSEPVVNVVAIFEE